jgi:hypothetical protein
MAALRIIMAIGLLTGLIVVPMTAASANTNLAPVNPGSVSIWSPAGLKAYADCPTADAWPEDLEDYDLYHWVVTDETYTVGQGRDAKNGKWTANFKKATPAFSGSSYVEYKDGGSATLPWVSFGYTNIPSNHLYTAVPAGKQVVKANLNYVIDVEPQGNNLSQKNANYVAPPSSGILDSSHVLSHTCATPFSDPVIDVTSVVSSYEVSHDEYYTWTLSKALDLGVGEDAATKWFDKGLPPVYVLDGTKAGPNTTDGSYEVTSVSVTGTFTLDNADSEDATISFEAGSDSELGNDPDCDVAESTPAGTYTFDCVVDASAITGITANLLDKRSFTIRGAVVDGEDDTLDGSFGAADDDVVDETTGESATLDDDLAGLGVDLTAADCDLDSGGDDATCDIDEGDLSVSDITESFTVTYTGGWDWTDYETQVACETAQTNTATLSPDQQDEKITREFKLQPKCPTPDVDLEDISATYDLSYDNVYTWSITKTLGEVGDDMLAPYTVTATRSEPEVENVEGTDVTVTGSFTTEFADADQVTVEITEIRGVTLDDPIACAVEDDSTFECTIPSDELPDLGTEDTESGWDGVEFTVVATVNTAGGTDSDSSDEELDEPKLVDDNYIDASAIIVDDLDGYAAKDIECLSDGESCWSGSDNIVAAGAKITTDNSDETIVLTYNLVWLANLKLSEECPTIANTAEVFGDSKNAADALASETTEDEMTCPVLVLSATHTPAYTHTWDTDYSWTFDKSFVEFDSTTWQPKYSVTATRGTGTEANFAVVDGTQQVTGTLTLALDPATGIPTAADAEAALTLDGLEECVIGMQTTAGTYSFTCTVVDEAEINAKHGLANLPYTLAWSGSAYGADAVTGSDDSKKWGDAIGYEAGDDVNASATITDDTDGIGAVVSSIVNGTQSGTTLTSTDSKTFTMSYTLNWQWNNGNGCGQEIVNTATLDGSTDKELATDTVTTTVTCPNAIPAFTIGYYGNKAGGTQVVNNRGRWRTGTPDWAPAWHNALGTGIWSTYGLPDFGTDSAVRTYMNNANCNSGGANAGGKTCQTMFRAQALASVNNAIRTGAKLDGYRVDGNTIGRQFANQGVLFRDPQDGVSKCWKVHDILAVLTAAGTSSVDGGLIAAWIDRRIAYKTIFDDLNNARAKRCPLVP